MALAASNFAIYSALYQSIDRAWILPAIVVAGLVCMAVSFSIAELASMFPSAPGLGTYLKAAFGRSASRIMVLLYLTQVVILASVESYAISILMVALFPGFSSTLATVGLLVLIVLLNLLGVEPPQRTQWSATLVLVLGILGLAVWSLASGGAAQEAMATSPLPGSLLTDFPGTVGLALFLYLGFEWVTPLGRSPKAYERLVPLSMPLALAILIVLYTVFAAALEAHIGQKELASTPIPHYVLATRVSDRAGGIVAASISFLATTTSFNAGIMGASRLVYSLARERSVPAWCATTSLSTGAPIGAILVLGAISIPAALTVQHFQAYGSAAAVGAAIQCFTYGALIFAALRLRKTRDKAKIPYRNRVPAAVQVCLGVMLPLLGVAALVAQPDVRLLSVSSFVLLIVGTGLLSWWSLAHQRRLDSPEQLAKRQAGY
ncbi:APC family permease [Sorangium sp. KYC3313]|uniref:APC family permease n=1 Tax=Sorangium sp. KYC3313 TaxID=3449740 RepID=UPI003F8C8F62